jgi:hypothetical protein
MAILKNCWNLLKICWDILWPALSALGSTVWRWLRVIWVCRVPAISVVGGGLLLSATPQAQDFFADLGMALWQWFFFLALVFMWAWIAHASARRALQNDDWVPEAHTAAGLTPERRAELQQVFKWPALIVPRALGLLVFFFVGWSICQTHRNIKRADALPDAAKAADLSMGLLIAIIIVAVFYVFFVWNWRSRNKLTQALHWARKVPGLVLSGTAPFLAKGAVEYSRAGFVERGFSVGRWLIIGLLIYAIIDPHSVAGWFPRLFFVPLLFAGIVLLLGEVAAWSHRLRTPLLLVLAGIAGACLYFVDQFHDVEWVTARKQGSQSRQIEMAEAVARWRKANNCEEGSNQPCPRPILIAGAGGASRAAFLTATFTGALMDLDRDPSNFPHYGNVRNRIFAMSTVSGSSLGAAVMRAAMMDAAFAKQKPLEPPCIKSRRGNWFGHNRLATDVRYDVADSWRDCFQAILANDFLSPVVVGLVYRDNFPLSNWITGAPLWPDRARLLEQGFERGYRRLTDHGHAYTCKETDQLNDTTGLCRPFGYHPDPAKAGAWIPLLFFNSTSVSTGRRVIVADVPIGQTFLAPGQKQGEQQERILLPFAYDLWELRCRPKPASSSNKDVPNKEPLGKDVMSKNVLKKDVPNKDDANKDFDIAKCRADFDDIRLSTAAGVSARFPIISPHGLIRSRETMKPSPDYSGGVIDRLVDGGYFENDGLATIADIADALKAWNLEPVVFRIVNEPSSPTEITRILGKDRPPAPDDDERSLFDGTLSIVRALTATRSGHEDGHAAYLRSVLGDSEKKPRLYEIGVHKLPVVRLPSASQAAPGGRYPLCRPTWSEGGNYLGQVSMSWWMSQPLQTYLDAQLCVEANWQRILCELEMGRASVGGTCVPLPLERPNVADRP